MFWIFSELGKSSKYLVSTKNPSIASIIFSAEFLSTATEVNTFLKASTF
jgi:hypothetical protein